MGSSRTYATYLSVCAVLITITVSSLRTDPCFSCLAHTGAGRSVHSLQHQQAGVKVMAFWDQAWA